MKRPRRSADQAGRDEKLRVPSARRAILVSVQTPETTDQASTKSLDELQLLIEGLGFTVETRVVQKRESRASSSYLGKGKLRELAALTGGTGEVLRGPEAHSPLTPNPDGPTVFVDDDLSPGQLRNLQVALGVEVLDRTAVILRIFEARANTREAKLEVELARLEYELPRVRDDHSLGDKEGGGGRASRGHTNVELTKQRIRDRMAQIRRELEQVRAIEDQRLQTRSAVFRVALVGYTNSGKSSLMRLLTGSDVLVEDKLFATLGTTTRALVPPATPPIHLTDTVGFISRLPHTLIASFRSTLAEAKGSALLLHVVDASSPDWREHARVTEAVLGEIGIAETPTLLILNKIDRLSVAEREALAAEFPEALQTNAHSREHGVLIWKSLTEHFRQKLECATFTIPYAKQGLLAEFREMIEVLEADYGDVITLTVRASEVTLAKLRARL